MTETLRYDRLCDFIGQLATVLDENHDESAILQQTKPLPAESVRHDDWLDEAFARPDPQHYQQYLPHIDLLQRFSVVSFVCGLSQKTPVHDHRVWDLIGMLRGAAQSQSCSLDAQGCGQRASRFNYGQGTWKRYRRK